MIPTPPDARGRGPEGPREGAASAAGWAAEPIFYEDGKDWRIVDLRPRGVDCIPLFAFGNFALVRPGAEMHVHPGCIEVSFCLKGLVRYETEERVFRVLPGHVFLSRPDEPHRRLENPKGMKLYRFLFALPKPGGRFLGLSRAESSALAGALSEQQARLFRATPRLVAAFARIFPLYDVAPSGGPASENVLRRLEMRVAALELMLALVEAPGTPHAANGSPNRKVREIAGHMEARPERDYPVRALAAEAGVSPFAFREMFKRLTGLPPHAWLVDLRVRRARADIARGAGTVSFVADRWGFSSPQHMATAFRRILGVSPTDVAKARR